MELSPGDIFDAETDTVPENVTADLQRQSYSPRQCELVTDSGDLVTSAPEEFYSLKLAGDHAYLVKDHNKAVGLYEKYLRNVSQFYLKRVCLEVFSPGTEYGICIICRN